MRYLKCLVWQAGYMADQAKYINKPLGIPEQEEEPEPAKEDDDLYPWIKLKTIK